MIARAVSKHLRISPRKTMLVTRHLKRVSVPRAFALLATINKKASHFINMTLKSAVDNARKKDQHMEESNLYISKITADGGPMLKRFRAGSMGRAFSIRKRTCHLTIELDAKEKTKSESAPAKKAAKAKVHPPKLEKTKGVKKPNVTKQVANPVRPHKAR